MSNIPKEVLKNYIKEQNFSNPNEVKKGVRFEIFPYQGYNYLGD